MTRTLSLALLLVSLFGAPSAQTPAPTFELPAPTGKALIGTTRWVVTDTSRDEMFAPGRKRDIEIVALAGFMRVLTPFFVRAWAGRILNIHPSLLPKYPGIDTHARALQAGETQHGCTVHLVTEKVDTGEILGQAKLPVLSGDTPETLAARVLELEHALYPRCLAKFVRT